MTNYVEEEKPSPPKSKRQKQHRRKRRKVNEILNGINSYEEALEFQQGSSDWHNIWDDPADEPIKEDTMIRSYVKIYNTGHKAIEDLLEDPVVVQEKLDGSQFSWGVVDGKFKMRSKRAERHMGEQDPLFKKAIETVYNLYKEDKLEPGWIYRGEAITSRRHNTLEYDRIPKGGVALFDIDVGLEDRLDPDQLQEEADKLGLEMAPILYKGKVESLKELRERFIGTKSFLGGAEIEGIVIKNHHRFGPDGKALMGKIVSEDFREKHRSNMDHQSGNKHIREELIDELTTEARWRKAIQHRREDGELEEAPRDIGPLMEEIQKDIREEEEEYIKDRLFEYFWDDISRGVVRGFPEKYKEWLQEDEV